MNKLVTALAAAFLLISCAPFSHTLELDNPGENENAVHIAGDRAVGSGSFIQWGGKTYILTAAHVLDGQTEVGFVINDEWIPAVASLYVSGYEQSADIGVLILDEDLTESGLGYKVSKAQPKQGDPSVVSAYPLGIYDPEFQYQAKGEYLGVFRGHSWYSTPCTSGCSGSSVRNGDNEVIGIVTHVIPQFDHMIISPNLSEIRRTLYLLLGY